MKILKILNNLCVSRQCLFVNKLSQYPQLILLDVHESLVANYANLHSNKVLYIKHHSTKWYPCTSVENDS